VTSAEEFTEFASGAAPRLRRTAFLLCGNWHTAFGQSPISLAITPDGRTVYVVNIGSRTVTPIDVAHNTAGAPVKVGPDPQVIVIAPRAAAARARWTRTGPGDGTLPVSAGRSAAAAGVAQW
jgi:YVTN family beta-propeller protein